jgi:chitinase
MNNMKIKTLLPAILILLYALGSGAQNDPIKVIGYFSGKADQVYEIPAEKLSQVIFSFCHLKGNHLHVDSPGDSITITKLVSLKRRNPQLKVVLSLGGWGGCGPCSDAFSTKEGRSEFSKSVLSLSKKYKTDGIDLDWEYPAIEGYPGHAFKPADRANFTELIKSLRKELGPQLEISFAAGGFKKFLEESVDWATVMPLVDRVNLMTYDLVNGYSTVTGHHTPLFSSDKTTESTDNAVQYLVKKGVPKNKLVIGAAFYARIWEEVPSVDNGLYQSGKFKTSVDYKNFGKELSSENGFQSFWDPTTQSPYMYNASKKLFATFDDKKSIQLKTKYAIDQKLQGIMFWELTLDNYLDGLLSEMDNTLKSNPKQNKNR